MRFRLTNDQIMTGTMSDAEFSEWFCKDILQPHLPEPWVDLGPDVCKAFVTNGRKYCIHFGILRPDLQAQYIYLMWVLAPNMHEVDAIAAILNSTAGEVEKINALFDVNDSVADEAVKRANMIHWYPEEVPGNVLGLAVDDLSDLYSDFGFLDPSKQQPAGFS